MTDLKTAYGVVHAGGPCKDDYANIRLYHRASDTVKLQGPAMRSFKDAEAAYGRRSYPIRSMPGAILLSGSWRSCAYQTQLWRSDPHRYASPNVSLHCRGLAIDVINPVPALVRAILLAHGWHQVRPDDEPWHFSFGFDA